MSGISDVWQSAEAWISQNIPGVRFTSGLRSTASNNAVGGVNNSYHLTGQAIDVVPTSGTVTDLYNSLKSLFASSGISPIEFLNEGQIGSQGPHVHVAFAADQTFPGVAGQATEAGDTGAAAPWNLTDTTNVLGVLFPGVFGANMLENSLSPDNIDKTVKATFGDKTFDFQDLLIRGAFIAVALILLAAGIFILAKGNPQAIIEKVVHT
jgi:hypothetical protein